MNAWNEFKIVWVGQIVRLDFRFCAFDFIDCINFDQRVCSMFCQKWHNLLPLQLFEKAKKCTWYNYLLDFIWLGSVCMPPFFVVMPCALHFKRKSREKKSWNLSSFFTTLDTWQTWRNLSYHKSSFCTDFISPEIEIAQLETLV